ncbi:unnamed protein product [Camellia sinensis]
MGPRLSKRYDDPRESRSRRDRRSPAPSGLLVRNISLDARGRDTTDSPPPDEHVKEEQDECDRTFVLKDDLGYVCRICGVVQRGIETIIKYQYANSRSLLILYFC